MQSAQLMEQITKAVEQGLLTQPAKKNIQHWLDVPFCEKDTKLIADHIAKNQWSELDQAFWQVIPFGTAGRRGRMYPIGSAAINTRIMGETVQALATYVRELPESGSALRCAIAYDCRHRSLEFATLAAEILVANGFEVYFLAEMRSTPQLAATVRHYDCNCGLMITASHNPPSDNAVKVFWGNGGQLGAPHDSLITQGMKKVTNFKRTCFEEATRTGQVKSVQATMDSVYQNLVLQQGFWGPKDLSILFSPLHGVAESSVVPVLEKDGFKQVAIFAPHREPNGDFPNVPNNIANPENPNVFDALIEEGKNTGADIAMASDPDGDRIGVAAPLVSGSDRWQALSGNQIGALIGDYILRKRQAAGSLSPESYIVKTIVTSDFLPAIAASYGVQSITEVLTGFKWISHAVDQNGPEHFVFGTEEAHGYLVGDYIRDKDASVAALLLAQQAAEAKQEGRTLHQELDALYERIGCYQERSFARAMPGAKGMDDMMAIMSLLRNNPPRMLGGMAINAIEDYQARTSYSLVGEPDGPIRCAKANMLVLPMKEPGYRVAVRPSGTEPKIKFYLFANQPVAGNGLNQVKADLQTFLDEVQADILAHVGLT